MLLLHTLRGLTGDMLKKEFAMEAKISQPLGPSRSRSKNTRSYNSQIATLLLASFSRCFLPGKRSCLLNLDFTTQAVCYKCGEVKITLMTSLWHQQRLFFRFGSSKAKKDIMQIFSVALNKVFWNHSRAKKESKCLNSVRQWMQT